MYEKIQETASWLKERMTTSPKTAIILGTGLGQLASEITDAYSFSYNDIPNFPVATVTPAGTLIGNFPILDIFNPPINKRSKEPHHRSSLQQPLCLSLHL